MAELETRIAEAKGRLEARVVELDSGLDRQMGDQEPGEAGIHPDDYEKGNRRWKHDASKPRWFKFRRSEEQEGRLVKQADEYSADMHDLRALGKELASQVAYLEERVRDTRQAARQCHRDRLQWAHELAQYHMEAVDSSRSSGSGEVGERLGGRR